MKTKVKTVCGLLFVSKPVWLFQAGFPLTEVCDRLSDGQTHVNRSQAGVHPFMRNRGPSSLRLVRITWRTDYFTSRPARVSHADGSRRIAADLRSPIPLPPRRSGSCS